MTQELNAYYNELSSAYDSNELYFTTNDGRAHNAMIMRVMLEKADVVNMYCGEMSVFRKGFYDHIRKYDRELGDEMERLVASALEEFLNNDKKSLTILLESFKDRYLDDLLVSREDFTDSNVALLTLPESIGNKSSIPHLSFTGDERMVRLEMDKRSHEAVCRIGGLLENESPQKAFDRLRNLAIPVNFSNEVSVCMC